MYLLEHKVFERNWYFVLALLVEDNLESTGVVVYLEQSSHWLLKSCDDSANNNDLHTS